MTSAAGPDSTQASLRTRGARVRKVRVRRVGSCMVVVGGGGGMCLRRSGVEVTVSMERVWLSMLELVIVCFLLE